MDEKQYLKDEKAFKLLASKFNQSVEVILELTKRVEKLETLVRLQSMQNENLANKSPKTKPKSLAGKTFFFSLLLICGIYFFYFHSFQMDIFFEIFKDIFNLIKN